MDAEDLLYADDSFDVVVAQYVVTAVPIRNARWTSWPASCAPGGRDRPHHNAWAPTPGFRGTVEKALMPITSRLGFRTRILLVALRGVAAATPSVRLVERRGRSPPMGHFSLVRFEKRAN